MRKSIPKKRELVPDPKYKDTLVTRFVNSLMVDGKKSVALAVFYDAIDQVSEKTEEDGLGVWKKALTNIMPPVEVKSRRVGGSTFQIPVEVRPKRKLALGITLYGNLSSAMKNSMDALAKLIQRIGVDDISFKMFNVQPFQRFEIFPHHGPNHSPFPQKCPAECVANMPCCSSNSYFHLAKFQQII